MLYWADSTAQLGMFLKVLEVGKSALFLTSVVLDGNFSSPLLRWSYKKNVIWLAKKKKKKNLK